MSGLTIVHRYGPCSPLRTEENPSHEQIINNDRARVNSLQHRRLSTASNVARRGSLRAVSVPAYTGDFVSTSNYIVNVGIGTPKQYFSVEFDTGSDLSWIQCKPCSHCYPQNDLLFDPAKSSTYSSIRCGSAECAAQPDPPTCSADQTCRYKIEYGDKSRTSGRLSRDTLTLGARDLLPNFLFGCGDHNRGTFGRVAGLIGLGRGESSLISQALRKYGAIFSYCLPSFASSTGYLLVGSTGNVPAGMGYTRMILDASDPSSYYVKLVAIKVGGKKLDINQKVFSTARTLMDSGSVITRLPPAAYSGMRAVFRRHMANYKRAPALETLDTCYDLRGHEVVKVPAVELVFEGGASLNLDIDGIMFGHLGVPAQVCLAFAGNSNDQQLSIIGNTQQVKFTVVYDISYRRIGFAAKGCS